VHNQPYNPAAPKAGVASYPTLDGSRETMGEMASLYKRVQAADQQTGEKTNIKVILRNLIKQ
jgi:hypothetical protein